MHKSSLLLMVFLGFLALSTQGQTYVAEGVVRSSGNGEELPGVTVAIKGTLSGTTTNFHGRYSIEVPAGSVLVFSFMGMLNHEVKINHPGIYDIVLQSDSYMLEEFVVTALGIEREKKALGYSIQQVSGDDLHGGRESSMINQLAGKVAGLSISSTNAGAGSSSRIVLRGNNSFMGDNNALIVVDGVPIDNSTISNAEDEWGGRDYGNGVSDINPEDIESISVLKGASASALYGSRAANGVILITTKKGSKHPRGLGVSFSHSTSLDQPHILYELQNTYGAGRNGKFEPAFIRNSDGIPVFNTTGASAFGSWGPAMEGQEIVDWDGQPSTYSPQPNNYRDYFQNGHTINNSLALDTRVGNTSIRFSAADMRNREIIENASFARTNLGLNIASNPTERVLISSYMSFLNQQVDNRFGLSDSKENPNRNYIMMPRNISNRSLQNNITNAAGAEQTWFMNWAWQGNPFYFPSHKYNGDNRNRAFGNASLRYTFNDNLNFLIRTAPDFSITRFEQRDPVGARTSSAGHYSESETERFLINTDFLVSFRQRVSPVFAFGINAGGNAMIQRTRFYNAYTIGGLREPGLYSIENSFNTPYARQTPYHTKAVNSLYGLLQLEYNGFLYLDLTGRNDWSSTLPQNNNSYFYPSASLGFVYSELMQLSPGQEAVFSFGKLRASYAIVGNDTDPYQLHPTFFIDSITNPFGTIAHISNQIPPLNLKPERIHSIELGNELIFFMNRASLDITWYRNNARNQILPADISHASGSTTALINAGDIQNQGIELQLRATPVSTSSFSWEFFVNYTRNQSRVIELTEGLDNLQILQHWNVSIEARPGRPYGDIVGYAIARDENGNKLVDGQGMYIRNETPQVLGNVNPDFALSGFNALKYKDFTLSFLVDARIGGQIFSGTNLYGYGYSGNFKETLHGRAQWYESEQQREAAGMSPQQWTPSGGLLAQGVYAPGTIINGTDVGGQPNQSYVNPENYWDQFSSWTNEIHEPFVYDASFVKLREASLTWAIPRSWTSRAGINNASLTFFGRNLWLIHKNVPNIDPESMHTNSNGQGYELYSYPNKRSMGLSISVGF
ncbi:MAG: SusC/RagA family TonB-linked outer membrane protein [Bacteroidetes bacterium]|nr:MAG: SusC/RagA family TonB-linked outer membrane protein [Bacteroidota bacterium]